MNLRHLPWIVLLLGGPVAACSCGPSTLERDLEQNPNAFLGKVVSFVGTSEIEVQLSKSKTGEERSVKLSLRALRIKVLESWKGPRPGSEVIVATPSDGSACGFEFERYTAEGDSNFVIFARPLQYKKGWPRDANRSGWLVTGLCSGSFAVRASGARADSLISLRAAARARPGQ